MVLPHLRTVAGLGSRLVLGAVMLVAGLIKIPDPAASVRAVRAYQALPEALVEPVGYLLPITEVVLGALLIVGLFTRTSAVIIAALQVVFIAGITWAWTQGLEIDCGCFGGGGEKEGASAAYPYDIARDIGFIALAWVAWKWPVRRWSVDRFLSDTELAHDSWRRDVDVETVREPSFTDRGDTK